MNQFLSEFIYGSVDGLITTFAIISSSVGADIPNIYMIIICLASILSDGFSMGVSRYLSYNAETKYNSSKSHLLSGIYTFISFVLVGILPVIPFLVMSNYIFESSVVLTFMLFILIGFIKGKILKINIFKTIVETGLLGVIASLISYYVGYYLKNNLNNT